MELYIDKKFQLFYCKDICPTRFYILPLSLLSIKRFMSYCDFVLLYHIYFLLISAQNLSNICTFVVETDLGAKTSPSKYRKEQLFHKCIKCLNCNEQAANYNTCMVYKNYLAGRLKYRNPHQLKKFKGKKFRKIKSSRRQLTLLTN